MRLKLGIYSGWKSGDVWFEFRQPPEWVQSSISAHASLVLQSIPASMPPSTPSVSLGDAIATAERTLGGVFNGHAPSLEFVALQDGSVALTHVVQVENATTGAWLEAFVDAHENKVQTVTDFVAKASCRCCSMNGAYDG